MTGAYDFEKGGLMKMGGERCSGHFVGETDLIDRGLEGSSI